MDESLYRALSKACGDCQLAGGCCFEARPPLSQERISILIANGISPEVVEHVGYKRLKLRSDGFCVLFKDGKCQMHTLKPETCVAGPFTFDMKGSMLQIFLKKEGICPMVRTLKSNQEAYDFLFDLSVQNIIKLVKSLPLEELSEVLDIEEPETDLVAEIDIEDYSACH